MAMPECNFQGLSDSDLKKAEDELGETVETRAEGLKQMRELIAKEKLADELSLHSDDFLLRFLRTKKFRVKDALKTLVHYHKFVKKANLGDYTRVRELRPVLMSQISFPLQRKGTSVPAVDRDGSRILMTKMKNMYPDAGSEKFEMIDFFHASFFQMEMLLRQPANQIHGFTVLEDLTGMKMFGAPGVKMDMKTMKLFFEMLQDCMPARIRKIIVIHPPPFIKFLMSFSLALMPKKFKKRIFVLGDDHSKIQEYIAPENIPTEYGGSLEYDFGETVDGWFATIEGEQPSLGAQSEEAPALSPEGIEIQEQS